MTSGRFGWGGGGWRGACAPFAHPWIRACIAYEKLADPYFFLFHWILHSVAFVVPELFHFTDSCIVNPTIGKICNLF